MGPHAGGGRVPEPLHLVRGGESPLSPSQSSGSSQSSQSSSGPVEVSSGAASQSIPSYSVRDPMTSLPPFLGESALVDGTTSKIYWSGGSGARLSRNSLPNVSPIAHFKASLLTVLVFVPLWFSISRTLFSAVRDTLAPLIGDRGYSGNIASLILKALLNAFVAVWNDFKAPLLAMFAAIKAREHHGLPLPVNPFKLFLVVLYFIEALSSNTSKYLANIKAPAEVEEHVEGLRASPPSA